MATHSNGHNIKFAQPLIDELLKKLSDEWFNSSYHNDLAASVCIEYKEGKYLSIYIPNGTIDNFDNDKKIINLHISYLPWNKGASPNLWSVVEETKKGVSIHYVDSTLDTGEIIVQKELDFGDDVSLKESYLNLIHNYFIEN